jgi:protein TonB
VNPAAAPIEAPREIIPEPPPRMTSVVGGISTNIAAPTTGVVGGIAPPPPPPPPAAPLRVGGDIKEPKKTKNVPPLYPRIAQQAKIQGMVIIEATIAKDGKVKDAKVIRSIPMLDQAALDAVRQWEYTPPMLNNTPVDVLMTVTVNFTLN